MKRINMRRGLLRAGWLLVVASAAGCGGKSQDAALLEPAAASRPLADVPGTGDDVWEAPSSRAEDLATPDGVAGTVAILYRPHPVNGFEPFCTATLIERRHLLTAGHCIEVPREEDGLNFADVRVWFPQQQFERTAVQPASGFEVDDWFVLDSPTPGEAFGPVYGKDLALIRLKSAVPPTTVANVARVLWDDWSPEFRTTPEQMNLKADDAFIVGAGTTRECPDITLCGGGVRRVGAARGLRADSANRLFVTDRNRQGAVLFGGDSGGPLFVRDESTGRYFLVGVNSARDHAVLLQYHAWPGRLNGEDHAKPLMDWMGEGDLDEDGVLDSLDNCPPWRCRGNKEQCRNAEQLDEDDDGIGDACDNCAPAMCRALAASLHAVASSYPCQNFDQTDTDYDGIGDTCDLCPETRSENFDPVTGALRDADLDGVGDACDDACAAWPTGQTRNERSPCNGEIIAECPGSRCIVGLGKAGTVAGHCAFPPDADFDGIPDACDACERDPRNAADFPGDANRHVELAFELDPSPESGSGYIKDDICDPTPLARIAVNEPAIVNAGPIDQSFDRHAFGLEEIGLESWVGTRHDRPSLSPDLEFAARVAFRHCTCLDPGGNKLSEARCALTPDCNPRLARDARGTGAWKPIRVLLDGLTEVDPLEGTDLPFAASATAPANAFHGFVVWKWLKALHPAVGEPDENITVVANEIGGFEYEGTHGLFASVLVESLRETELASYKDEPEPISVVEPRARPTYYLPLTASMALLTTPNAVYEPFPKFPDVDLEFCRSPGCHRWIFPWLERMIFPDLRNRFTDPALVGRSLKGNLVAIRRDDALDLTPYADPDAAALFGDALGWSYVPAETSLANTLEPVAVFMPRTTIEFADPVRVDYSAGKLKLLESPKKADRELVQRFALAPGEAAFFSDAENSVYAAGGSQSALRQVIRRFDFGSGRWSVVRSGDFDDVLTLSRLPNTQTFVVLDRYAKATEIRLSLLNAEAVDTVWSVPWTGLYRAAYAVVAADGSLIVFATSDKGTHAWRWRQGANGSWAYAGGLEIAGSIMDAPVGWARQIWLPLEREGSPTVERLDLIGFTTEVPWNGL